MPYLLPLSFIVFVSLIPVQHDDIFAISIGRQAATGHLIFSLQKKSGERGCEKTLSTVAMWFFLRRGIAVVMGTITLAQAVVVEVRNPSPRLAGTDHYPTHQGCSGAAFQTGLREVLSPGAIVTGNISSAPRWSDYNAPQPGTVVNVATEHDVQKTVSMDLAYPPN